MLNCLFAEVSSLFSSLFLLINDLFSLSMGLLNDMVRRLATPSPTCSDSKFG